MMIHPEVVQIDLIADLKGTTSITSLLASADEVKESQYQGTRWNYPALRLAIIAQTPIIGPEPCDLVRFSFAIRVYTEGGSSKSNSHLLGIVNDRYHRRIFEAPTWISVFRSAGLNNPSRATDKLWRGEALFEGTIYPKG